MKCVNCGAEDMTIYVETALGDLLCRRCWADTTAGATRPAPATPRLDRLMAQADAKAEQEAPK